MSEITVVTPASRTDLALVEAVYEELREDYAVEGATVQRMVAQASEAARRYCGRSFARERLAERFSGIEVQRELYVSRTPIVTVHEVRDANGVAYAATAYRVENSRSGRLRFMGPAAVPAYLGPFGWAWPEVTVEYTGGYILPPDPLRDLPASIERAVIEIVRAWFHRLGADRTMISETIGDYTYRMADPNTWAGLPPEATTLLDEFRRPTIV